MLTLWPSLSLCRCESNVRSATVLGLIGAGCIGQVLFESIRGFYDPQASGIIIVTVTITDPLSSHLRKMVI